MGRHGTILLACAWVLWAHSPDGSFEAAEGYEAKAACELGSEQKGKWAKANTAAAGTKSPILFCLPDTVDPRK